MTEHSSTEHSSTEHSTRESAATVPDTRALQPLALYGSNISYFTGKLENYFRVRGVPYQLHSMQLPGAWRQLGSLSTPV